jgi:replicative DNA helicase Mcm
LIFTVKDAPDREHDTELADHILDSNHAGELRAHEDGTAGAMARQQAEEMQEQVEPEVQSELFRQYVAYAKNNCFPAMADEARQILRDFYVDLRAGGGDDEVIPVTARKLEALVRLAEASARVRLSNTVEPKDAEQAVDIVQESLDEVGRDPETGEYDVDVIETGTSKTERDRIKNLRGLIEELEEEHDDGVPYDTIIDNADDVGLDPEKVDREIEKLKQKGELYEPNTGQYRITGA